MGHTDDRILDERVVPEGLGPIRLDRFVAEHFDAHPTRAGARKAVRRGEVSVDGEQVEAARFLHPGQRVALLEPEGAPPKLFPLALDVVYEDEALAAVVKVPGFPVNGARHRTIEHALPGVLRRSEAPDALRWPRPVHRLDAPTGGLLLCAKTRGAMVELGRAFQERRVRKRYRAIAVGRLEGEGEVDLPVDERPARSRWAAVARTRALRSDWLTTVDLWPLTGRTHQLRRHLSALGHPILGDARYGLPGLVLRSKGLFLWAVELALDHPVSGEPLRLEAPEPPKFESLRQREARRWARWHAERGSGGGDEGAGADEA